MKKENKKQNKRNKIESIPKQYGWICPKCGSVWAPWVDQCKNCVSTYDYIPITTDGSSSWLCYDFKIFQ